MQAKPKIRISGGRWLVDFGDGKTATLGRQRSDYLWRAELDGDAVRFGLRASLDEAFVSAWCALETAPAPVQLELAEVEKMASWGERGDASDCANILRRLLRQRTGKRWSVRSTRRPQFGVRICSANDRLVAGAMPAADRAMLSAIFGTRVGRDGVLVGPEPGCRETAIWSASGLDPGDQKKSTRAGIAEKAPLLAPATARD